MITQGIPRNGAFEAALTTLLWQGREACEGSDAQPDCYSGDSYDTSPIPDDVRTEVAESFEPFQRGAEHLLWRYAQTYQGGERGHTIWDGDDGSQLGHDWVLSSFSHGTGFWDRYSGITPLSKLGSRLQNLTKLFHCPDVSFPLGPDDDGNERWFES